MKCKLSFTLFSSDTMWQGILMEPETIIEVFNGSSIKDVNCK
jgi:hypothetical protein